MEIREEYTSDDEEKDSKRIEGRAILFLSLSLSLHLLTTLYSLYLLMPPLVFLKSGTETPKPAKSEKEDEEDEARMARLMHLLALEEAEEEEEEAARKEREKESSRKRPKSALKTESSKVTIIKFKEQNFTHTHHNCTLHI